MPALHSPSASALRRRPAFCVPWKQTSPMAKSRSKVSRQPAKKSSKAAARRTRAAKARLSRSAKPVATARKVTAKPVVKPAANAVVKPTAKAAAKKGQWVYGFGGGKAEGRAEMRNLLGGKGAGLAEMAHLGLPVPPGFTITTEVCTYFYEHDKTYPKNLKPQVEAALARGRPHHREEIRRRRKSAARLRTLGRARVDAGHDGHGAQSRAQRRHRRGAGGKVRRPALRLRQLPALHHHVFRRGARHSASSLRGNPRRAQGPQRLHARHRPRGRRLGSRLVARFKERVERGKRHAISRRIRTRNCGARSAPCSARG